MGGKTIGREAILSVVEKGQQGGEEKMATYIAVVIIAVVISLIVATATAVIISIICCNISAMKTFNTIDEYVDRKSTRLNSHACQSRMTSYS